MKSLYLQNQENTDQDSRHQRDNLAARHCSRTLLVRLVARGRGCGCRAGCRRPPRLGHGIRSGADLQDVVLAGVEVGLGQGDLVVSEIVDDVCAAQEGIAQQGLIFDHCEAKRTDVHVGHVGTGLEDHLADVNAHVEGSKVEQEGEVFVLDVALNHSVPVLAQVLGTDGFVDAGCGGGRDVGQGRAAVQHGGDGELRGAVVDRDGVAVLLKVHGRQVDRELDVHVFDGDDRQGLQAAVVLGGVDSAEQNGAFSFVEVIQP